MSPPPQKPEDTQRGWKLARLVGIAADVIFVCLGLWTVLVAHSLALGLMFFAMGATSLLNVVLEKRVSKKWLLLVRAVGAIVILVLCILAIRQR
jgi:hypothetical protein